MPTNTINLNLVTYNSTTDSQNKFLTFRGATNGVDNSNMTKIDTWAGTVNTKITELENQKPTILINATWISMGYYEATSSEIDTYVLDMLLTLRLDKDSDGTTTIKINSLPVKSLMKYGADGTLVNLEVGDLRIHHEYSFRYDGTSFVWQGGTSADQMNIVGNVGEIVTIASDKTLETSGVALTNVAMKSQIKNNLTETTTGNVLDATQGTILDNKIGVLSELTTTAKTNLVSAINENHEQINVCLKMVDRNGIDLNTIRNTGTQGYATNCTNKPYLFDGVVFDYKTSEAVGYQEYINYYDGKKYNRFYLNGVWQPWTEMAIKEKVETLWTGTANTGTLTLTKKATNFNEIIFRFTSGFICSLYSWDYPSVFNTGTYVILVQGGSITMSFANGDITITSNTTNINFEAVRGIKRGDISV